MAWDEGHHLYDGYRILKSKDYGLNPEVPPLAKLVAATPLLNLHLRLPVLQDRDSQLEAYIDGKEFLFRNDANQLLSRGRLALSLFAFGSMCLMFFFSKHYFGTNAALLAVGFFVFDPTIVAHGALVTTDSALTFCFLATIVTWIAHLETKSTWTMILSGMLLGCALATKFTGILLIPALSGLAALETLRNRKIKDLLQVLGPLLGTILIAVGVLWAFYGFRYDARPTGLALNPPLTLYLQTAKQTFDPGPIAALARFHILPEGFLWGLINTKLTEQRDIGFAFGKLYRHGVWWYFPAALVVKSTISTTVLVALSIWGLFQPTLDRHRMVQLALPSALFMIVAMHSSMNIGVRHIMPVLPFIYLVGGHVLNETGMRKTHWKAVAILLLAAHACSTLKAGSAEMAYSNEFFGGSTNTHRYLSDSNSDWGQQLKAVRSYIVDHRVTDCWIAYTAQGAVELNYYGVHCRELPTAAGLWWFKVPMDVPPTVSGTIFVSDDMLSGVDDPWGGPHPYGFFRGYAATEVIQGGIHVFKGTFDVQEASSMVAKAHSAH